MNLLVCPRYLFFFPASFFLYIDIPFDLSKKNNLKAINIAKHTAQHLASIDYRREAPGSGEVPSLSKVIGPRTFAVDLSFSNQALHTQDAATTFLKPIKARTIGQFLQSPRFRRHTQPQHRRTRRWHHRPLSRLAADPGPQMQASRAIREIKPTRRMGRLRNHPCRGRQCCVRVWTAHIEELAAKLSSYALPGTSTCSRATVFSGDMFSIC
jgi:hypothetical protein